MFSNNLESFQLEEKEKRKKNENCDLFPMAELLSGPLGKKSSYSFEYKGKSE